MGIKIDGCIGFPEFCRICEKQSDSCSKINMHNDEPPYIRFKEQLAEGYEGYEEQEDEDEVPFANLEKTEENDIEIQILNRLLERAEKEVRIIRDQIEYYVKKIKKANPFKFEIDQTIFFMYDNKVYQGGIKSREVVKSYGRDRVIYKFYRGVYNPAIYEDQAYATKEELLASL